MNFTKISIASIIVLLHALLAGCQTTREVLDLETSIQLNFSVSHQVNPDEDGRPSPLSVSMVLLSDNKQFEQADFIRLFQDSEATLAGDLLSQQTFRELVPGETRKASIILSDKVKYVGLIAAYSQYNKAATKLVLPIVTNAKNEYNISVNKLGINRY